MTSGGASGITRNFLSTRSRPSKRSTQGDAISLATVDDSLQARGAMMRKQDDTEIFGGREGEDGLTYGERSVPEKKILGTSTTSQRGRARTARPTTLEAGRRGSPGGEMRRRGGEKGGREGEKRKAVWLVERGRVGVVLVGDPAWYRLPGPRASFFPLASCPHGAPC